VAHEVSFALPDRVLGSAPLEISVRKNGSKLGRLKLSKGSAVWIPRDKTYGYRLGWADLAGILVKHGKFERK
jgi:hypothetical protein